MLARRLLFTTCAALGNGLLLTSCAAAGGTPATSGRGGAAQSPPIVAARDARVLIGEFDEIYDVALSRRYLFAAAPGGIAVYDRVFNRWENPVPVGDGVAGESVITAMSADPVEDAVWFATPGALNIYRPGTDQLQRVTLPATPDGITFGASATRDAFVRTPGQWFRVSRSGIVTPVAASMVPAAVPSNTLTAVFQRFPALRNQLVTLLREPLPNRPVAQFTATSGALSPERSSEVWLGTNGNGIWRVDPTFQQATPLRFGLMSASVGAVATDGNGVWMAPGDARRLSSARSIARGRFGAAARGNTQFGPQPGARVDESGIVFASNDLQHWRWLRGTIAVPLPGLRARDIALRENRAWLATDRGVVLMMLDGSANVYSVSALTGLPSDDVLCVAAHANGVWVGTARGLVFVSNSGMTAARESETPPAGSNSGVKTNANADAQAIRPGRVQPRVARQLLNGVAVYALQQVGDALFVGTSDGLYVLAGDALAGDALARVHVAELVQHTPVLAFAWSDTALLVATENGVVQLHVRAINVANDTGSAQSRIDARVDARIEARIDVRSTGQPVSLAMDDRSIVVAGTNGLLTVQRDNLLSTRFLSAARDLSAEPTDVAISRDWVWVATSGGLLRLNRRADGALNSGIR